MPQQRLRPVQQISIHALREEGDHGRLRPLLRQQISIHALREEGDTPVSSVACSAVNFYPRPPRGGRRCQPRPGSRPDQFLSTPSARRATGSASSRLTAASDFYPRPPRGGRPRPRTAATRSFNFYPRPPRGGRPAEAAAAKAEEEFLSTPSARRATRGRRGP